jgi:HSP20 family protein
MDKMTDAQLEFAILSHCASAFAELTEKQRRFDKPKWVQRLRPPARRKSMKSPFEITIPFNTPNQERHMRTSMTTPVSGLRRDIDRLFEEAFGASNNGSTWMPLADVRETKTDLNIEFELPGLRPEDVEITTDNGVLTVSGEKRGERKEGDENSRWHLIERTYGRFTRSFQLPKGVNDSEISAEYDHGVLRVRIPKSALPQPRKIEIGQRSNGKEQAQVSGGSKSSSKESDRSN